MGKTMSYLGLTKAPKLTRQANCLLVTGGIRKTIFPFKSALADLGRNENDTKRSSPLTLCCYSAVQRSAQSTE